MEILYNILFSFPNQTKNGDDTSEVFTNISCSNENLFQIQILPCAV